MRMSRDEASAAVGYEFAGHIHNGGTWLTGKVIAYCAEPTLTIERENGTRYNVAIGTIGPFLVENRGKDGSRSA